MKEYEFGEKIYDKWQYLYQKQVSSSRDKTKQTRIELNYQSLSSDGESLLSSDIFLANKGLMAVDAFDATYQ